MANNNIQELKKEFEGIDIKTINDKDSIETVIGLIDQLSNSGEMADKIFAIKLRQSLKQNEFYQQIIEEESEEKKLNKKDQRQFQAQVRNETDVRERVQTKQVEQQKNNSHLTFQNIMRNFETAIFTEDFSKIKFTQEEAEEIFNKIINKEGVLADENAFNNTTTAFLQTDSFKNGNGESFENLNSKGQENLFNFFHASQRDNPQMTPHEFKARIIENAIKLNSNFLAKIKDKTIKMDMLQAFKNDDWGSVYKNISEGKYKKEDMESFLKESGFLLRAMTKQYKKEKEKFPQETFYNFYMQKLEQDIKIASILSNSHKKSPNAIYTFKEMNLALENVTTALNNPDMRDLLSDEERQKGFITVINNKIKSKDPDFLETINFIKNQANNFLDGYLKAKELSGKGENFNLFEHFLFLKQEKGTPLGDLYHSQQWSFHFIASNFIHNLYKGMDKENFIIFFNTLDIPTDVAKLLYHQAEKFYSNELEKIEVDNFIQEAEEKAGLMTIRTDKHIDGEGKLKDGDIANHYGYKREVNIGELLANIQKISFSINADKNKSSESHNFHNFYGEENLEKKEMIVKYNIIKENENQEKLEIQLKQENTDSVSVVPMATV